MLKLNTAVTALRALLIACSVLWGSFMFQGLLLRQILCSPPASQ